MKTGHSMPLITKTMLVMAIAASVLLLITIVIVFIIKDNSLDNAAFSFAAGHTSSRVTGFMLSISFLGKHSFLIPANILLLLGFIFLKEKGWALRVAVVSLSSLGLMSLLKNLIQRHRPENPLVDGITNYGFPSGHATMSVAFYGLLIAWFAWSVKDKWYRAMIICFLVLLIILIGYSRIYLRVHYATDIVAGFCIGTIWLIICLALVRFFETRRLVAKK